MGDGVCTRVWDTARLGDAFTKHLWAGAHVSLAGYVAEGLACGVPVFEGCKEDLRTFFACQAALKRSGLHLKQATVEVFVRHLLNTYERPWRALKNADWDNGLATYRSAPLMEGRDWADNWKAVFEEASERHIVKTLGLSR